MLLAPVRVWRPKGADIAIDLLAQVRAQARQAGEPDPCLAIFGSLAEDPEFADDLVAQAGADLGGAAAQLVDWLAGYRAGDPGVLAALEGNGAIIAERFPREPTRRLLLDLAGTVPSKATGIGVNH